MGLVACDAGDPERQVVDAPPVRLLSVTATGLDEAGGPARVAIAADGSSAVRVTTSFVLTFDRYLDPRSAIRQSVCLRSSTVAPDDPLTCEGGIFLRPSYDPVLRELTFFQQDDQPRLAPETLYRLTIFSPLTAGAFGVQAFDGAPLSETTTLSFSTSAAGATGTVEQLRPPAGYCGASQCELFCLSVAHPDELEDCELSCTKGVRAIFRTCGPNNSGCHGDGIEGSPLGLDLTAPEFLAATALGEVAHQKQTGENADEPAQGSARFGHAMPIIDPGNAGNSYLIYKLLADDTLAARLPGLLPGETERLRRSLVVGLPMPIPTHKGDTAKELLRVDEAVVISKWIADGARMDCALPPG